MTYINATCVPGLFSNEVEIVVSTDVYSTETHYMFVAQHCLPHTENLGTDCYSQETIPSSPCSNLTFARKLPNYPLDSVMHFYTPYFPLLLCLTQCLALCDDLLLSHSFIYCVEIHIKFIILTILVQFSSVKYIHIVQPIFRTLSSSKPKTL